MPRMEYITIHTNGPVVHAVWPNNAETDSAKVEKKKYGDVAHVLNKMAKYGYELMPFVIPFGSGPTTLLVMRRGAVGNPAR